MKTAFLIFSLLLPFFSRGQGQYPQLADSIYCFSIPMNLSTVFNVHCNEIILGKKFNGRVVSNKIIDKASLKTFSEIFLSDTNTLFNKDFKSKPEDVDARIVLLKYNFNKADTLIIDSRGFHLIGDKIYNPNIKLLLWVNEFGVGQAKENKLFNDSLANKLKSEHNYLLSTIRK